jgi:hypothetical protein
MRDRRRLEARLRRFRPDSPRASLRETVLSGAARSRAAPPPSRLERLWYSRPARLAAAACLAALLAAQVLSDRALQRRLERAFGAPASGEREELVSLARSMGVETVWKYRSEDAARLRSFPRPGLPNGNHEP